MWTLEEELKTRQMARRVVDFVPNNILVNNGATKDSLASPGPGRVDGTGRADGSQAGDELVQLQPIITAQRNLGEPFLRRS